MKSGIDRTGATTVINNVTWPHGVVYNSDGKPASYQDISVRQFVYGYMTVMDTEGDGIMVKMSTHLKDLMSDAQLYSWGHIPRPFTGSG